MKNEIQLRPARSDSLCQSTGGIAWNYYCMYWLNQLERNKQLNPVCYSDRNSPRDYQLITRKFLTSILDHRPRSHRPQIPQTSIPQTTDLDPRDLDPH